MLVSYFNTVCFKMVKKEIVTIQMCNTKWMLKSWYTEGPKETEQCGSKRNEFRSDIFTLICHLSKVWNDWFFKIINVIYL